MNQENVFRDTSTTMPNGNAQIVPPVQHPCPNCGACPTCGRHCYKPPYYGYGYPVNPQYPQHVYPYGLVFTTNGTFVNSQAENNT